MRRWLSAEYRRMNSPGLISLPRGRPDSESMHTDEITVLLRRWRDGDEEALAHLTPLVFDQLKQLAARIFRNERHGHTLQPTALVNELFERLIRSGVDWQDRTHFFALSARIMRRVLVNHAEARRAAKRGGDALRVTLQEESLGGGGEEADLVAMDEALTALGEFDSRKSEMLELHYFGGLTYTELAEVMQLSESTVHQELRTGRAWLRSRLADDA